MKTGNNLTELNLSTITRMVNKATANLAACSQNINNAIPAITCSCDIPGTRGFAHHKLLQDKIFALKNLDAMCNKGARRLLEVTARLKDTSDQKKVLDELLVVSNFINDQLSREEEDAQHIVSTIRGVNGYCEKGGCL